MAPALALAAAGLLLAASLLTPILPDGLSPGRKESTPPEAAPAATLWDAALGDLLAGRLDPSALRLVEPLLSGSAPPASPGSLGGLLAQAGAAPAERLPIPPAPAGPEPLLQALKAYASAAGVEAPADAALRPAIAALRLDPAVEDALARLVLAYVQALDLHARATAGLAEEERRLLAGDPAAVHAWSAAHPGAGAAGLEAWLADLARDRIDGGLLVQAADLLARSADLLTDALDLARAATAAEADAGLADPALSSGASDPARLHGALGDPWEATRRIVQSSNPDAAAPPLAPTTLDAALRGLLEAAGLPASALRAPVALPPSLDRAIAGLVAAQALGLSGADPTAQALAVLDAAEAAEPTLRAWSALLAPSTGPARADRAALLAALLTPLPDPAAAAAAAHGAPAPAGLPLAQPLATLLVAEGLPAQDALDVAGSLPLPAAEALALLLSARADLLAAHARLDAALPPAQRAALDATPAVADLLGQPTWTPAQAGLVRLWAEGVAAAGPELDALRAAQADAARNAQRAADLLRPLPAAAPPGRGPAGLGVDAPQGPSASAASSLAPCREFFFTRCKQDVYLMLDVAGGILVTGDGSTALNATPLPGNRVPHIVIDLGGDDVHRTPAGGTDATLGVPINGSVDPLLLPPFVLFPGSKGPYSQNFTDTLDNATSGRLFAATIDVGGNDTYTSNASAVQGAALGLGAVGLLLDLRGNDTYEHAPGNASRPRHAQGFGGHGGLGLLLDAEGSDAYAAPGSVAQGAGLAPPFLHTHPDQPGGLSLGDDVGGTGLLLDLGPGNDTLLAGAGQGLGGGYASVGVLLDLEGPNSYTVQDPSPASQGGRRPTATFESLFGPQPVPDDPDPEPPQPNPVEPSVRAGGLALLLDLGGAGDAYASLSPGRAGLDAEAGTLVLTAPGQPPRKQDDTLWLSWTRGPALGLDSGLGDSDGDLFPDLAELLAGSDPHAEDGLLDGLPRRLDDAAAAADEVVAMLADGDDDAYPDGVERQLGTDPDDPDSRPVGLGVQPPGFLLDLAILCPSTESTRCGTPTGPTVCDPARFGDACISVLSIGNDGPTTYTHPALVQVDLGGDDTYASTVAGRVQFWAADAANPAAPTQGISLDLLGHDDYLTPGLSATQGHAVQGAALLLDLDGDDAYEAGEDSQAAAGTPADTSSSGLALLADFLGNDDYRAGQRSQGSVTAPGGSGGWAALLDLRGDDGYLFSTQGSVQGSPQRATAMLLDASGLDTYDSTSRVDPVPGSVFRMQGRVQYGSTSLSASVQGLFADLGPDQDPYFVRDAAGDPIDATAAKNDAALVANPVGTDPAAGTFQGPQHAAAYFSDGLDPLQDGDEDGVADLAEILAGSDPRDGASAPLHADPDALAGVPVVAEARPDGGLLGHLGALGVLRLPGLLIGGELPNAYAEYTPFLVDLGGNDTYTAPSAGGSSIAAHALFAPPGISGQRDRLQLGSVALLLDAGPGDDVYRPADCVVAATVATSQFTYESQTPLAGYGSGGLVTSPTAIPPNGLTYTSCPSLGGTMAGVAILSDGGGRNDFSSRTWVNVTVQSTADLDVDVRAWGATQGAALFEGVGLLATRQASNRFHAEVHVRTRESDPVQTPFAHATGLAQGAAWGYGTGILASLGTGDDAYGAVTTARAPHGGNADGGLARDLAQGAALGGVGLLVDEGGDNRFSAPSGWSQGFAEVTPGTGSTNPDGRYVRQPTGLLWSGPGNDTFLGGPASQASASPALRSVPGNDLLKLPGPTQTTRVTAMLLDGGGSDAYSLAPIPGPGKLLAPFCPSPATFSRFDAEGNEATVSIEADTACFGAQGFGRYFGTAVLLDLAGDDRYDAGLATYVQGAGIERGAGFLLDLGGNDLRRARANAQGYADNRGPYQPAVGADNTPSGVGMLADLAGRDAYFLLAEGQGFSPPTGGNDRGGNAVFLDAGGHDRYDYGGEKVAHASAALFGPQSEGNNWAWTDPNGFSPASGRPAGSLGIDASQLDQALAALRAAQEAAGADPGSVELAVSRDAAGEQAVPDGATASGLLHLRVDVTPNPGYEVQRVDLLQDDALLGVATRAPGPPGTETFLLSWDTRAAAPDPAAVRVPDGPHELSATAYFSPVAHSGSFVGAPDGLTVESDPTTVVVDNPPVVRGALVANSTLPGAIAPGRHVANLTVAVSSDRALPAGQPGEPGRLPGGTVAVTLRPAKGGSPVAVAGRYVSNGSAEFVLDGRCQAATALPRCPDGLYLVNTTVTDAAGQKAWLPEAPLLLDATPPTSRLLMPDKANLTYKSGSNSGLRVLWQATDDPFGLGAGHVAGVAPLDGVTVTRVGVESLSFGPEKEFAVFSNPSVGSGDTVHLAVRARDALGNQEPPCPAVAPCRAHVFVDFSLPELSDVSLSPASTPPDSPITFKAKASDVPSGLASVQVRLFGVSVGGTPDPVLPLQHTGAGAYALTVELDAPPTPGESTFAYFVRATDLTGNVREEEGTGLLDGSLPRLSDVNVTYDDGEASLGRPGGQAFVALRATDREVVSVEADATLLNETEPVECDLAGEDTWTCTLAIPANATDGDYPVPITARDAAGNANQTVALVQVAGLPPRVLDANVTATGPDFIEVTWRTATPAFSQLRYGKTPEMSTAVDPGTPPTLEHTVRIPDLAPATKYFVQPTPRSLSNVANLTAPVLQNRTDNGFRMFLPGFDGHVPWGGTRHVLVAVENLAGDGPVTVSVKLQEASLDPANRSSPVLARTFTAPPGVHTVPVDTAAFADGVYVLVVDGVRGPDTLRISSGLFRVDNTAPVLVPESPLPGSVLATARPTFRLGVTDPLNPARPPLQTLAVRIDGLSFTPAEPGLTPDGLAFTMPADLPTGDHFLLVRLADATGNVGEVEWAFRVDVTPPALSGAPRVGYAPGPLRAAPGGQVHVDLNASDSAGVAGVAIDLGPAGGKPVPLFAVGAPRWNGTLRLPANAPSGLLDLPILATDGLGNKGVAGLLRVAVDGSPPAFAATHARAVNLTAAELLVTMSEPAALQASQGGAALARSALAETHFLVLRGLRPGQVHNVTLSATDGAGHAATATVQVALAADEELPDAPGNLTLASPEEGQVELRWDPARDNAGVAGYLVARLLGDDRTVLATTNATATRFLDAQAPAGRNATYEVRALDVAGLAGPASAGSLRVLAYPRVADGAVSPATGPSDRPFRVEVVYSHPAGTLPGSIVFRYGGQDFPLEPLGGGDCLDACRYGAEVLLPPLSTLQARPEAAIVAVTDGQEVALDVPAPLVTAGAGVVGITAGEKPAPAPAFLLSAAALALAALIRRRKPA